MASASEIQQQVLKEKIRYAAGIRRFEAENWDRLSPEHKFSLAGDPGIIVYVFDNGEFRVSDDKVYEDSNLIMELFRALKPLIEQFHPDYFLGFENLSFREFEVSRVMKLENLMVTIENSIDILPQLKEELIRLGKALENGEDVKSYIRKRRMNWEI